MAITSFDVDVMNISRLTDQPNDNDGMTADELKALFDKAPSDIKDYINNVLIPELVEQIAAAAQGIAIDSISGQILTNGTVTQDKLSQEEGLEAVVTNAVRNYAITKEKLSQALQQSLNTMISNIQTLQEQMLNKTEDSSLATVAKSGSYNDLSDKPVIPTVDTALSSTSTNPVQNSAIKNAIDTKQDKTIERTVTFARGAKSRTISCSGVTASNSIDVTYAPASFAQWVDNRMRCTAQGNGTITVVADTAPTADVSIVVRIYP